MTEYETLMELRGDGNFSTFSIIMCGCSKIPRMMEMSGLVDSFKANMIRLERMIQILQAAVQAASLNGLCINCLDFVTSSSIPRKNRPKVLSNMIPFLLFSFFSSSNGTARSRLQCFIHFRRLGME